MAASRGRNGRGKKCLISQSWLLNKAGLKINNLALGLWVWRWPQAGAMEDEKRRNDLLGKGSSQRGLLGCGTGKWLVSWQITLG